MGINANKNVVFAGLVCWCMSVSATAYQQSGEALYAEHIIDWASINSLYGNTAGYLWLDKLQPNKNARLALEFISSSVNHGLDPDDYHYQALQQLDPQLNRAQAQRYDTMLSDGLLQLLEDLATGRLDPGVVDPKWSIPRVTFNAVAFLQNALSSADFKKSLNSLLPASTQYQQLVSAAERYQQYEDRGGWQEIPVSPVLKAGDVHDNVVAIRERLLFEDEELASPRPSKLNYYDKELEAAVRQFQRRHSLFADGVIGSATLRALNVSATERLQQININLERWRWLPYDLGKRYIMVNLANYRLTAIEDGQVKLDMRVIVGKIKRSTPSFSSKMTHIVTNPRWYIPNKLARLDLLPKQKRNPSYFKRFNIRVYANEDGKRIEIDPASVDWESVSGKYFPYSLVQDPGNRNALGRLKFILPNPWKIYLHDTPSKSLFNKNKRNFSAGCIRVEDPFALADFSMNGSGEIKTLRSIVHSNESIIAELKQPVSVYAIYATVWFQGDEIVFSPDSYKRDQVMAKYI